MKITLESFLAVLKRSGLIAADRLKPLLEEFQQSGGSTAEGKPFADWLVDKSLLTSWQAEKLLQGKHKGFFLGKYRLLNLLGKGGMSSVYLAEHVLMRRRCAIKVLPARKVNDTSYLGRFHREAQAVAALDHPNIVRAYDVDQEQDGEIEIHFLVMEFVNGPSLLDMVNEQGPLHPVPAAEYVRQAAMGLEHAHRAGLIHRDIKPGNLLVDESGVVKVMDLGLARFFSNQEEESLTLQYDEKVLGTADYLAPEQAVDSHRIDARADIYSLGCTLYFLLTGHPPFAQGTLPQRLMAHQTKEPPPIEGERKDVPPSLLALVRRMMSKKPEDRPQSAAAVAEEFLNWLRENGGQKWNEMRASAPEAESGSDVGRSSTTIPVATPAAAAPPVVEATPVVEEAPPVADEWNFTSPPPVTRTDPPAPAKSPSSKITKSQKAAPKAATRAAVPSTPKSKTSPDSQPMTDAPKAGALKAGAPKAPAKKAAPPQKKVAASAPTPAADPADSLGAFLSSLGGGVPVEQEPQPLTEEVVAANPFTIESPVEEEAPAEPEPVAAVEEEVAAEAEQEVEAAAPPEPEFSWGAATEEESDQVTEPAFSLEAPAEAEEDAEVQTLIAEPQSEAEETVIGSVTDGELAVEETAAEAPAEEEEESLFTARTRTKSRGRSRAKAKGGAKPSFVTALKAKLESLKSASGGKIPKPVMIGGIAGGGLLLIGLVIALFATGGDEPTTAPDGKVAATGETPAAGTTAGTATPVTPPKPAEKPRPVPTSPADVRVGPEGHFATIAEAQQYMADNPPLDRNETRTIRVAGGRTYTDRIIVDGWAFGSLTILGEGTSRPILKPAGSDPVIKIIGSERVRIEGFAVDAAGKSIGVQLGDIVKGTRLVNIDVTGFTGVGVDGDGARGLGRDSLELQRVTVKAGSASAFGIRFSGAFPTELVTLDTCTFIGPMQVGLEFQTGVSTVNVRRCRFLANQTAVHFAGRDWEFTRFVLENNTIHDSGRGIVFDRPPSGGTGVRIVKNLFGKLTGAEIESTEPGNPDAWKGFIAENGLTLNATARAKDQISRKPLDLFAQEIITDGNALAFDSLDPTSANFLKPQLKELARSDAPGTDKFIGALAP